MTSQFNKKTSTERLILYITNWQKDISSQGKNIFRSANTIKTLFQQLCKPPFFPTQYNRRDRRAVLTSGYSGTWTKHKRDWKDRVMQGFLDGSNLLSIEKFGADSESVTISWSKLSHRAAGKIQLDSAMSNNLSFLDKGQIDN